MENNLYKKYKTELAPKLKEELGLKNVMQVPKVDKIVINVGVGKHTKEASYIENVERTLHNITGQHCVRTKAKKAISNFKTRAGMVVGVMVTLRGQKMYDFLEKLLSVTLPRVRDFRGINPEAFDENGNYNLGFKENLAFPEIKADEIDKMHGLEITICTTAKNKEDAKKLLTNFGFPFKKR
jgi:large subunit ribosomal protein L5